MPSLTTILKRVALPNGDRMVEVEDPDNLPESFIHRLRDRIRPRSKPVDLNQVSARLPQPAPPRRRSLSISSSVTSCSVTSEDIFQDHLQQEKEAYYELAKDGGRPFYPIELLPGLSRHPERYPEIVRYWSEPSKPSWRIFATQLLRWQLFRDFQKANRDEWKGRMETYQKAISRRLAQYSITLPQVEFQEDWTRQDRLTDWIEYACYTCFVMRVLKKWEPIEYELRVAQLKWIADQIPLVQAELKRDKKAGVKRNRTEDNESGTGEPPTKKRKTHGREGVAASRQSSKTLCVPRPHNAVPPSDAESEPVAAVPEPGTEGPRKRLRQLTPGGTHNQARIPNKRTKSQRISDLVTTAPAQCPLRRSKRIAERQSASQPARPPEKSRNREACYSMNGAKHLDILTESVNKWWNNSISFTNTRPQPDYSVGFKRDASTEDQLAKLSPFIGDFIAGDQSFLMATYYMYFPFLTCEVKCGGAALDIADRQNAHSMTVAVRAIVELFRAVKREDEVNRQFIVSPFNFISCHKICKPAEAVAVFLVTKTSALPGTERQPAITFADIGNARLSLDALT
ncbi:hypothetical protein MFIFM68171_02180 [Madurella fahalii]|uniref:DUF7924 domain-containing protein n=1 Tax=Madurella fahalii TaxID=1157608 RepID=A0ABQ0G340_9PEZI